MRLPAGQTRIGIAVFAAVLLSQPAVADSFAKSQVTVSDLYSQNYGLSNGHGIPIGAFLLLPNITADLAYDDNVFATRTNRLDDFILEAIPELRLVSHWSRHSLDFLAGVKGTLYENHSSEDRADVYTGARGVMEIQRDLKMSADVRYERGHEARGTGDSFYIFDDPVEYGRFESGLSIWKQFNRLWTQFGGTARRYDFENAQIGTTVFDQDYRDETTYEVYNRTGYELSPKTSIFGEAAYRTGDYRDTQFDGEGYRVLAGVEYEFSQLVRGNFAAGYLSHGFDQDVLRDIGTWTYNAQIFWDPTPLTRFSMVGKREVGVAVLEGTNSSRLTSELGLRADYEIRRDVRLTGIASYEWIDFEDAALSDRALTLSAGGEYFLNPEWSLLLNHYYMDYDRGLADADYSKNKTTLGARGRF